MTAVIIHLSDIHVRSGNDPILARGEDIARASYRYLPEASHVFVIVTGDIAYSGKAEEYEAASAFLGRIRSSIVTEFGGPVSILVVPGNHDCDFESESGARTALLRALDNPRDSEVDDHFVSVCTTVQNNFFDFREKIEDADGVSGDRLWRTARYVIEGREFLFECLNVSWTSRLQETPGLLYFPVDRFSEKGRDTPDIRVALLHHPLNWYAPAIYRQFRKELRKLSNIILSGHEHVANVGINIDSESEESAYIEGCVLICTES